MSLRKRDKFLYGVVFPIAVMIAGLLIIMNHETGAGAAEFASLGIFLGAIMVAPIVLLLNSAFTLYNVSTTGECFRRGMILPGLVLIGAAVYQSGLWDAVT